MKRAARLVASLGVLSSRLGRRFVALFAGCALLPLAVFAWIAVNHTTDQLRRDQVGILHNGAKTAGMGIAARLSQIAGDLALARECALRPEPREPSVLAALQRHVGGRCASVWIVSGDAAKPLVGEPPRALPALQARDRAQLAAGKPCVYAIGSPPQLVMLTAVDAEDPATALVAVRIRSEWFWDPAELRATDCQVAVFDEFWRPLFHSFADPPDVRAFAMQSLHSQAQASGTLEWTPGGVPHLARYWRAFLKPQYCFDFLVVQSRPLAAAYAVSDQFTRWLGLTALGILLLILVASLVQIRRTLGPIASLREATRRLAAGELQARVVVRSGDELGELGMAFNDMAAQLQENVRRREQTERELVASRDAALAAATAKSEFVTNVSHEFRTPMTEILGATEILTQLGTGDDAAREEFSRIAMRGAQRLARLIDDVLELGTQDVWTMAPVDLGATVRAAVAGVAAEERGRIRVDLAGALPHIVGNAERLKETWGRLLDNAIKFSAPRTPVDVVVRSVGRHVAVEIRDQGVGIAKADQRRVFEPFCQAGRDQLTDKASGTGLGLTLAKNAIDRHGGRIEIESEVGKGSTFCVLLPAHAELPAARV